MNAPDVSFVVTVYNKRAYLPLLIASIKAQQGLSDNCEYIFVDDGSTDGSFELLHDLTRGLPNLKLIQKQNGGQTSALNVGLKQATRFYIKLWDADDYVHPGLTLALIRAMQTHNTELAYVRMDYSPFEGPDDIDAIMKDMDLIEIGPSHVLPDAAKTVLKNPVTNPTGLLATRTLIDKIGTLDERITIPDVYLTYAAVLFTPFATIDGNYGFAFMNVPGRLTSSEAQILHDINGALYCLYDNFGHDLPYGIKMYIGHRATGRAWKWAHRHNGKSILSGDFWRFFKSRISLLPPSLDDLYQAAMPFRVGQKIRTKL